jgi:hypothetical protein
MAEKTFNFSVTLDEDEFVQVEDHIFTTREILKREEPNVDMIGPKYLKLLKTLAVENITMKAVKEWLLLSLALDHCCSYHSRWDDQKILEELVAGREHSISWYMDNCQKHN